MLPHIHLILGKDYAERVLPSLGNEVLKATVAQYNADQLLTQRETVCSAIKEALTRRAIEFNIILEDVSITHLTFGTEFTKAVELKQVQHQEAEKAKFVVMRNEEEMKASVIKAEGEAEAAKLISDTTKLYGKSLIELRKIETAKYIASSLANNQNIS